MNDLRSIDKRNLIGCLFILAMVAAPFIASIYGLGFGLLVLTIGLILTAGLIFDARDQVLPERRRIVPFMIVIALLLAIVTGIAAYMQLR